MELTGAPIDMGAVLAAKHELRVIQDSYEATLGNSQLIKDFEWDLRRHAMIEANSKLKKKVRPLSSFSINFNPASPLQTQKLLHDFMGFPIIDTTDTNQPATGAKTIKKHLNSLINEYNITEEELNE
jgi:DNA polymerase-1